MYVHWSHLNIPSNHNAEKRVQQQHCKHMSKMEVVLSSQWLQRTAPCDTFAVDLQSRDDVDSKTNTLVLETRHTANLVPLRGRKGEEGEEERGEGGGEGQGE